MTSGHSFCSTDTISGMLQICSIFSELFGNKIHGNRACHTLNGIMSSNLCLLLQRDGGTRMIFKFTTDTQRFRVTTTGSEIIKEICNSVSYTFTLSLFNLFFSVACQADLPF